MNYKKHFGNNYRKFKERILEKNKGFWRVQSIHKLELKLSSRFNVKDFLMLKNIQSRSRFSPSFISFSNDNRYSNLNKKRLIKLKDKLSHKTENNIFITNENQKKEEDPQYKNKKKQIYLSFYKNFSYEPFMYNELPFIYMRGKDQTVPRKFSEVLKDCLIMDKYNKALMDINYKTLNSNDNIEKNNKFKINNIKLTDSNLDYKHKLNSIDTGKRNLKYIKNKLNHNLRINTNFSNTAYDGFYKNKKSEGVYTISTNDF